MSKHAFISYSSMDRVTADAARARLEAAGVPCWIAPRDTVAGRDWGESIVEAIENSRVMVLIFSGHANASPQVRREVERAVNKGVVIVPFRIENVRPCKSLEYFISVGHWMDAYAEPIDQHLNRLAETVTGLIRNPAAAEDAPIPLAVAAPRPTPVPRPRATVARDVRPVERSARGRGVGTLLLVTAGVIGATAWAGRNVWPLTNSSASVPPPPRTPAPATTEANSLLAVLPDVPPTPVPGKGGTPGDKTIQQRPAASGAAQAAPPVAERPAAGPTPEEAARRAAVEAEARRLRLSSVAVIGRQRLCVINGLTAREGDVSHGFVVRQVLTDRVVIVRDAQQFELRLEPKAADQRPAAGPAYGGASAHPGPPPGGHGAFYEPAGRHPGGGGGGGGPPPRPGPGGGPRGHGPR